jgi:transposase
MYSVIKKPRPATLKKYNKAERLVKQGSTLSAACEEAGLGLSHFYKLKEGFAITGNKGVEKAEKKAVEAPVSSESQVQVLSKAPQMAYDPELETGDDETVGTVEVVTDAFRVSGDTVQVARFLKQFGYQPAVH